MSRPGRSLGLQFLMERRAREEANRFYNEAAAEDNLTRQRAQFEQRTLNRYQGGELRRRAQERVKKYQDELEERRNKLAQLLENEENQYSVEIQNTVETPAKRRDRLKQQLTALRTRRQEEHDKYVAEKNEQGWRDSCDPLRHQVSEALQRQVIKERDQQVIEKELERQKGDQAEEQYAATVKENVAKWKEEQANAKDDHRQKLMQNRETWLAQMNEKSQLVKTQKEQEYKESLEFRTTVESQIKAAKEAAEKKAQQQAERRQELDKLNSEQIATRRKIIEDDKALDAKYAAQAAEELRQQEEDELVERIVRNRKAEMNRKLFETQLNKKAAEDNRSEMFLQRAQQEANDRDDELRRKDAEARRKLMLDAVDDRIKTIQLHENEKIKQRQEKLAETKRLEEELEFEKQIEQEEKEQRLLRIKNQYEMLQAQSRMKAEREAKEKAEDAARVKAMVDGWAAEEERIKKELANPNLFVGNRFRGNR
ncbi:hypothetical protein TVAG_436250 [Trichomonas vaginalis G3]|uniref:Cilia- and flagella-associated protein 53 n=1 Tax=Trichomonas vaginalis (strain ATCC PRA-98 / G3) TaxID=412133 RepID=A2G223_TRIV3|nr:cilia- and flagella-associated protein 53 family [Trichomonas vaginalis G3]EAX88798.1 hypothetical protein TVAG_436250 [Trichomonas vaginalis G3]KAI5530056.1 cilia- and flagella-associated protein 53 family [Trichomonas vaginalis G3]|eukprot:XP_001301728.1 hypothetical protein [Trichomonas vaginalis G3]